jgi:RNA recognition motif-containing protein
MSRHAAGETSDAVQRAHATGWAKGLLCNAALQTQQSLIVVTPSMLGRRSRMGIHRSRGWEAWPMRLQYFRGNVFVANLPPDLTEDELAEAFDPFGIVLSAFIARDPGTGKQLRYGFVDIATERAAKLAVDAMNGAALDGHNLDVRISERPNKAKKRLGTAGSRRATLRPAPRRNDDGQDGAHVFTAPGPASRKPSFQVERRSLPRRT